MSRQEETKLWVAPFMDTAKYKSFQHKTGSPIPNYWTDAPAWLLKDRGDNPLLIVDSPQIFAVGTVHSGVSSTWEIEDCAVCRHTDPLSGTVVDRLLGCVRFDYSFFSAPRTGKLSPSTPDGQRLRTTSQAPTDLWNNAVNKWIKWTDN